MPIVFAAQASVQCIRSKNETPKNAPWRQVAATAVSSPFAHTETTSYPRNAAVPRRSECRSHLTRWRPDWLAGHIRFELRNVVAQYPFERSHRFPLISRIPAAEAIRVRAATVGGAACA